MSKINFNITTDIGGQHHRANHVEFFNPRNATRSVTIEIEQVTNALNDEYVVTDAGQLDFIIPESDAERAAEINLVLENGQVVGTETLGSMIDQTYLRLNSLMRYIASQQDAQ